jgi:hypothetical protein
MSAAVVLDGGAAGGKDGGRLHGFILLSGWV